MSLSDESITMIGLVLALFVAYYIIVQFKFRGRK